MPDGPRLPAAPLRRHLELRKQRTATTSWVELATWLDVSERTLHRIYTATEVSERVADHMACRLGLHPLLLWPRHWLRTEIEAALAALDERRQEDGHDIHAPQRQRF